MCEFQGVEDIINYSESSLMKTLEFAKIDFPIINNQLLLDNPKVTNKSQNRIT